jgi:uncharacterized protein (DUF2147 family)
MSRKHRMKAAIVGLIGIAAAIPAAAVAPSTSDLDGIWVNPHNSVAVKTSRCGDRLCARVVWLNAEAAQDAQGGGIAHPIGTEVLQDYRPIGDGRWRGTVFVLDMGRSFSSRIEPAGPGLLKVSGCLVGGFLCKSQIWHRR